MQELIAALISPTVLLMIWQGLQETLYMVGVALVVSTVLGLPLGIALVVTEPGHLQPNQFLYKILSVVVNVGRSIPFIILMM
jgi:D-methionine transport system permease protein